MKKNTKKNGIGESLLISLLVRKIYVVLFCAILLFSSFLRFYNLETLSPFGWDQLDNAWAAQKIIINHEFPLIGMQAKGSSGIFIGPLYYYLISVVYFFTNLDPIASGIFAGITSIFSAVILYFVTKKIFNEKVALIAVFINSFAFWGIFFDRVQWPVNFIPAISLLVLFCLYRITTGNSKYILLLATVVGFSFHIHFTAIFYPIIIFLSLPFFPRSKETLKFIILGLIIFLIFISPIIIYSLNNYNNLLSFSSSYYHGFHLRRFFQLLGDAFIQFDFFLKYDFLKPLKFILVPLYILVYSFRKETKDKHLLSYLVFIFFLVPWAVMSTYSGELSDYYFASTRFIALIIISYLMAFLYSLKNIAPKILVVLTLFVYGYFNINEFMHMETGNPLKLHREKALSSINKNQKVEFREGVSEAYLYYYYMYKKGIKVY